MKRIGMKNETVKKESGAFLGGKTKRKEKSFFFENQGIYLNLEAGEEGKSCRRKKRGFSGGGRVREKGGCLVGVKKRTSGEHCRPGSNRTLIR